MSTAVHALEKTRRRREARDPKTQPPGDPVEFHDGPDHGEYAGDDDEAELEEEETSAAEDCVTCAIVAGVIFVMVGLFWFVFTHMAGPSELLSQRLLNAPQVEATHLHAHVDLAQLYTGHVLQVDVQRQLVCRQCAGSGVDAREGFHECHACHGAGARTYVQQVGPIKQHIRSTCNVCQGRGQVANKKCAVCHGHGLLRDRKTLDVRVERGMRHGDSVTLAHEGNQAARALPGDVIVHLHMDPHAQFTRRGDDLEMELEISLLEALAGFTRDVRHLDGRVLPLRRTQVVAPTTVWRIPGEGMPVRNATDRYGDLLVRFAVQYPRALTRAQQQRVTELLDG